MDAGVWSGCVSFSPSLFLLFFFCKKKKDSNIAIAALFGMTPKWCVSLCKIHPDRYLKNTDYDA